MQRRHSAQTLAALAILVAFAVGLFACLVAGAGSYRRLNQNAQSAYDRRTAASYLAVRVRQGERVSVAVFGGQQALCLEQTIEGRAYATRIYCHDGWLMELFAPADGSFAPEDGQRVLPMQSLGAQLQEGLLTICFTDAAGAQTLCLEVSP